MKYAELKDIDLVIQVLKQLKDKLKVQESYALKLIETSINRVILELEDMKQYTEIDTE